MLKHDPTYLPNTYLQYYLLPKRSLATLDPNWTRANEVMAGRERRVFAECEEAIKNDSAENTTAVKIDLNKKNAHGDMIVEIAESIYNDTNKYYIVIVKNDNIISNFEKDAMVEVLCKLGKDGAKPYKVGKISTYYKALMQQQYAYEKLAVEAYFENSYLKALQALTLNRTVVDQELAKKILDSLIEINGSYWPELK
jgi:maltose-6'-phosphate glucosidase